MCMYEVGAKCGHVGRNHYVEKVFAVCAESAKEAAAYVRMLPRVKHDHKDAIRYVEPIDKERYLYLQEDNNNDPYFQCRNIQEQRRTCQETVYDEDGYDDLYEKEENFPVKYYGKMKLKNPKKYINRYLGGIEYGYEAI